MRGYLVTIYDVSSAEPTKTLRRQLGQKYDVKKVRNAYRPDRIEHRAVKRRPKPYPLLNQPRRRCLEISHRSRYWKGRPRNYRGLN